jgi:hypothetical protein
MFSVLSSQYIEGMPSWTSFDEQRHVGSSALAFDEGIEGVITVMFDRLEHCWRRVRTEKIQCSA